MISDFIGKIPSYRLQLTDYSFQLLAVGWRLPIVLSLQSTTDTVEQPRALQLRLAQRTRELGLGRRRFGWANEQLRTLAFAPTEFAAQSLEKAVLAEAHQIDGVNGLAAADLVAEM